VQGLELNAGLQHVSGLCTDIADDAKENFTLLSLGAAYRLLPQVKLWVRGENLLAQKYEINKGFPMPKATFMSGVRVTF
jgi:iron complex outermembrane receptor protein